MKSFKQAKPEPKTRRRYGLKRTLAGIMLAIVLTGWFLINDSLSALRTEQRDIEIEQPQFSHQGFLDASNASSSVGEAETLVLLENVNNTSEINSIDKKRQEKTPLRVSLNKQSPIAVNSRQDLHGSQHQFAKNQSEHNNTGNTVIIGDLAARLSRSTEEKSLETSEKAPATSLVVTDESFDKAFTDPITGMEFVLVKGGCYMMGSDNLRAYEKPVHEVCVDDFYLGKYEVTQLQWKALMGRNLSYFIGDGRPVDSVNWDDCCRFINRLNGLTGRIYRLPTEAEWEYAARSGGKQEMYSGTNQDSTLQNFAWYDVNSNRETHAVGTKKPNRLGLHDMSGNVWEWCSDWYGKSYYAKSVRNNPQGPKTGIFRVIRGGEWGLSGQLTRTTYRDGAKPNTRKSDIGFRLVLIVQ